MAAGVFDELYASLADRSTNGLLRTLSRMRPIVIDELGYLTLRPEQVNMFFRLMDQRYGHVSTIITTEGAFSSRRHSSPSGPIRPCRAIAAHLAPRSVLATPRCCFFPRRHLLKTLRARWVKSD